MLDLLIKNVIDNSKKINILADYMTRTSNLVFIETVSLSYITYKLTKKIKKQDLEISKLKEELEQIKSKGE